MKFMFSHKNCESKECDVEIFKNDDAMVVKFFNKVIEPKEDEMIDAVYVDAGYGYLNLKQKGDEGILSGFLKKEFFSNESIILQARDLVQLLNPNLEDAYIPFNFERRKVIIIVKNYL